MAKSKAYELAYEDDDIIVVNKAAGVLSIPDRYDDEVINVKQELLKKYDKVYVVHRLDRETSGIMIFAKNAEAHRALSQQMEHRTAEKYYYVLVSGVMPKDEGVIDRGIAPDRRVPGKMMLSNKGKRSITKYRVIQRHKRYTEVEAQILTGRMHQIRVHFQHIMFPLAVDPMYGGAESISVSALKGKSYNYAKWENERPILSRVSLHAYRLVVDHPRTGERVQWAVEPPKDIRATVNQIKKWNQ